jgi:hypothetical protein
VGINFQKSYPLRQEYRIIKDRAIEILGEYLSPDLIKFDRVEKRVTFTTERLIPTENTNRPHVMLLFSNPHPHSIQQGMFLSATTKNNENLFWPSMRDAGWFSIPEPKRNPEQLRGIFLRVKYPGPFELYFYCYYAFPTRYPDHIPKIFGKGFFSQTIEPEANAEFRKTVQERAVKAIVVFNKGIFNLVSDEKIERYIEQLNKGELVQGRMRVFDKDIPIFLTHPTGWRYDKEYKRLRKASLAKIKMRIISARPMTRQERKIYEEG